jgi:predicted butyrate kinase (DUF1464 family)
MATKSANNAIELNYINFIPSNTSINFTAAVTNNGSPIADATAGSYANSAFITANGAYAAANNVAPQIQPAFDQANGAFTQANGAYAAANNSGGVAALTNILMLAGM